MIKSALDGKELRGKWVEHIAEVLRVSGGCFTAKELSDRFGAPIKSVRDTLLLLRLENLVGHDTAQGKSRYFWLMGNT